MVNETPSARPSNEDETFGYSSHANNQPWVKPIHTGIIVLADGSVIKGQGIGAYGAIEGEICFNTALTGYQEILTDPSYTGQIVTFTFPHIGNVGANTDDHEDFNINEPFGAEGAIFKANISAPSNYRANEGLDQWLKARHIIGITGVDTRALTIRIRQEGALNAVIAHDRDGAFDIAALKRQASSIKGLVDADLTLKVTSSQMSKWQQKPWVWDKGYEDNQEAEFHIVAIDYGIKRNILRLLSNLGAKVTVVPASSDAATILALNPDGIFLSNGPGDPAATGQYALPIIQQLIKSQIPIFGICLGHQLLSLAVGGRTQKMHQGHHGANHPVKDFTTGKVEIVSMNHGFSVDNNSLPDNVEITHISLFDNTNCGIRIKDAPVFSVQHHPEASPGPQDSHYLFQRFRNLMAEYKTKRGEAKK